MVSKSKATHIVATQLSLNIVANGLELKLYILQCGYVNALLLQSGAALRRFHHHLPSPAHQESILPEVSGHQIRML